MGKKYDRNCTEKTKMFNKHMKKSSTLPAIRELKIKTTTRYYHLPTRVTKIRSKATNVDEDVE